MKKHLARIGTAVVAAATALSLSVVGMAGSASAAGNASAFHGLTPARLMDTRPNMPTIDGQFAGAGPVGSGSTTNLTVGGRGGLPAKLFGSGVVLNVTVTESTGTGFVTVWPAGQPRPNASNLNYTPGATIPNIVVVAAGAAEQVSIFNSDGASHIVVDVLGYFPSGQYFRTPSTPQRIVDTRPGFATFDGKYAGGGAIPANSKMLFDTFTRIESGSGGVSTAPSLGFILNVTVTDPTADGFLTVYSGANQPTASNLNFKKGQTVANMVIIGSSFDKASIFNGSGGTVHVVVDFLAEFTRPKLDPNLTPSFNPIVPTRFMDTRQGQPTFDGGFAGTGKVPADTSVDLTIGGRGPIPASGVGSVALNVTVTNPTANGFITVWPTGQPRPNASNINFTPGATNPNMVLVPIGADGKISIYNSAGTSDIIVDVLGWAPTLS